MTDPKPVRRKLVTVGDSACGKTCLLLAYAFGNFPQGYVLSVFECYVADVEVQGKQVELALWDTFGQEGSDYFQRHRYLNSHVALICFSIDSSASLENVQKKWIHEVTRRCPGASIILVGTKKDLRQDRKADEQPEISDKKLVSPEEGLEVAQKIGAIHYLECSAKTGEGVHEVIDLATCAALASPEKPNRKSPFQSCCIL